MRIQIPYALALLLIALAPRAAADAPAALPAVVRAAPLAEQTLAHPLRVAASPVGSASPVWLGPDLLPHVPRRLFGLARVAKPGFPVFDPSSASWFATANGSLVRLEPDGRLAVVADGMQGAEVDVRWGRALAVSREPDDTIVVHRWGQTPTRKVLWRGQSFFRPRLSPDGSFVLAAESRAGGGRIWICELDGSPRDFAQGYGASWHPDGRHIVFARVVHDGVRIAASEIWIADIVSGEQRMVARPPVAAIEPVISPDATAIAFLDGANRDVHVARWQDPWVEKGR